MALVVVAPGGAPYGLRGQPPPEEDAEEGGGGAGGGFAVCGVGGNRGCMDGHEHNTDMWRVYPFLWLTAHAPLVLDLEEAEAVGDLLAHALHHCGKVE